MTRPTSKQINLGATTLDQVINTSGSWVGSGGNFGGEVTFSANAKFNSNVFDTPVITVTSSTHFADNAAGKIILANNTSDITLTFGAGSQNGFAVTVIRVNTGNVIIANTTGIAKKNTSSYTTANIANRYDSATVVYSATNEFVLIGSIS